MSVTSEQFEEVIHRCESSPTHGSVTAIRRLSDTDVRSIFEALHHNKPPPTHLSFSIVRVGPNGLKLSPPSYEFSDGLYVLLRPIKKNKKRYDEYTEVPQPPPHLQHLILEEDFPETCPWSLSGPQFPQPTAIQQRYCYPKGRPEYSSRKGGALWTMYGADGKEDVEYRLLHVYFSAKRAINKGMSGIPDGQTAEEYQAVMSPSRKRQPRQRTTPPHRALPKRRSTYYSQQYPQVYDSPVITTSSVTSSLCNSPLSMNVTNLSVPDFPDAYGKRLPNDGIAKNGEVYPTWPEQLVVTPINDVSKRSKNMHKSNAHTASQVPIEKRYPQQQRYDFLAEENFIIDGPSLSPFRRPLGVPPTAEINIHKSPLFRTGDYTIELPCDDLTVSTADPFHLDFPLQQDLDSFWNDPLLSMTMNSTNDCYTNWNLDDDGCDLMAEEHQHRHSTDVSASVFASGLTSLQENIRERILAAPISEQPKMISMMANWARNMAIDPLAMPSGGSGEK